MLRWSGWQKSPLGSSVLGIGLCSATDGEGPERLPAGGRPSLGSGQGAGPPLLHPQQEEPGLGGRVAQQLLHAEQQTGTGTRRAAAFTQSPWVPWPGPAGPRRRRCACARDGQHGPDPVRLVPVGWPP